MILDINWGFVKINRNHAPIIKPNQMEYIRHDAKVIVSDNDRNENNAYYDEALSIGQYQFQQG